MTESLFISAYDPYGLSFIQMDNNNIQNHLDAQTTHAIEAVIMVEYARYNNMTGDDVIKAFDGKRFTQISAMDIAAKKDTGANQGWFGYSNGQMNTRKKATIGKGRIKLFVRPYPNSSSRNSE